MTVKNHYCRRWDLLHDELRANLGFMSRTETVCNNEEILEKAVMDRDTISLLMRINRAMETNHRRDRK